MAMNIGSGVYALIDKEDTGWSKSLLCVNSHSTCQGNEVCAGQRMTGRPVSRR